MIALILPRTLSSPSRALSDAELRAAVLDGELVAIGVGYLPIDSPTLPADRAASLGMAGTEARLFAMGRSAAWIYGWCVEPARPELAARISARVPSGVRRRWGARELVIDESELTIVGGSCVTTPLRTLMDLARADDTDVPVEDLARMITLAGIDPRRVEAALATTRRTPFAARARARLLAVADAVHVVHRVDATHGVQHPVEVGHVAHFEHELGDRQAVA